MTTATIRSNGELEIDDADEINDAVDAAYRAKYGHYAAYIIQAVTSPEASSTTMRLVPRS
ncbi:DUF2255 family protein [Streptomyces sp. NPDC050546]|uniref:DUF2255 family protein n=1 Tax=Streptomyces sp. NPDC050546 TaxID=3365628 RepID=UPI0037B4A1DF